MEKTIKSKNVKMSEEQKLDTLLRWIKFDSGRNKKFSAMVKSIDVCQVSLGYRRYLIERETLVNKNNEVLLHFSIAMMDTMKVELKERDSSVTSFAVFDSASGHLQRYNPKDNSWTQMQAMNDEMKESHFSAVLLDKCIYALMESGSVFRLRYLDKEALWERVADMIARHGGFPPCVAMSGCLYVIGGHHGHGSDSIERYDPATDQWSMLPKKPNCSHGSEIEVAQKCIYSFGGCNDHVYVNKVQRYDPSSSTWSELAPMCREIGYSAAVLADDKVFILGGANPDGIDSVECYNLASNQWRNIASMNVKRFILRGFYIYGDVYAVGGVGGSDSIEKYNIAENRWVMIEIPSHMQLSIKESVEVKLPY